jgi:thiamine pyrophosphokinase
MRAIIIAGGQVGVGDGWKRWLQDGDWILGADGGAAQALIWGLTPQVVIGDMDSLPDEDRAVLIDRGSKFVEHPRAKDETDLELALAFAVAHGAEEIVILGALGGRLDHTLANVLLLALPSLQGVRARIVDGDQEAFLIRSGGSATLDGRPGDLVSLLPLAGDARGVKTRGLLWALDGDTLGLGFSRGVSNEMKDERARIELEDGLLLIVHGPAPDS